MIELKKITKIYKLDGVQVDALRGVDLTVKDGEFIAIMGPSGSGKSTLLQVIGLLDSPSSGSYILNGKDITHYSEDELAVCRREEIGFVFQQFNLLSRLTASENTALPLLYSEGAMNYERAHELLKQFGLGDRFHHRPTEMSGGQQQRVAISRALINRPRMILADEPTGNLDSVSSQEIMIVLKKLNEQGITVVLVTHEESISKFAKRVVRVKDGQILSDERVDSSLKSFALDKKSITLKSKNFRWFEHLRQGFRVLLTNKVRTALSMLGILIGVGAVVAMLALGRGAQSAIEAQLASLGSNLLVLRTGAMRSGGVSYDAGATARITLDDVHTLKSEITSIKDASPNVNGRAQITYQNNNASTQVLGVSASYPRMRDAQPDLGRFFTDDEVKKRNRVAVIGRTVMKELFETKNPIGEMVKINKVIFTVIGVLPEKGATGWQDRDDLVVIPVSTAMHRLYGKNYVDFVDIEVASAVQISETQDSILNSMFTRHKVPPSQREDAFQVRNMADIQSALQESSKTMSMLLATIAAISLLVGGIGIMNIMLVSVSERTREIGLRKAIGARRKDVLFQFLVESIVVSVSGGVMGIILGWFTTLVVSKMTGWATSVSLSAVCLSFFFSVIVGLLFGIYPARKASLLSPIEALRSE